MVDNTLLDMSTGAAKKQADDDASALYFGQAASKAKKGAAQPPPALSTVPIQGYTSRAPDAAGIALHATTVIATTHRKSYAGPRRGRTICLVCGTRFDSAVLGTTDAPWVHHPASLCPAFTLLPGVNGLLVLGAHVEGTGERLVFDRDADAIEVRPFSFLPAESDVLRSALQSRSLSMASGTVSERPSTSGITPSPPTFHSVRLDPRCIPG